MKKILVSLLFMVAAVASFAQIDSINYPARKMPFGNWDFVWTNGTLTDTVKVYPEKGGIGLDTLFFSDGTITGSTISAPYYTFNIPSIVLNGEINGLAYESNDILLADDDSIVLTNGISGWGEVYAFKTGTIVEWAEFIISTDGTVYLKSNSTNVVNTDKDDKLCIFDNGSGVTIRNRLAEARTIKYIIHH